MTPLLVVPLGMVVFGERPNLMALPFGLVTLAGLVAFISTGGSSGAATTGGDLLAVLALMCWAAYLAFSRRARATVGVTDFMATVLPIGLVVALPAALVQAGDEMWPLSTRTWVAVVAMSVLTGVVGHGLIASAQRLIDVGTISVIHVGQPAVAVMWAWVVLGERVAPAQLPGAALILAGLVGFTLLNQRSFVRRAAAESPGAELSGTLTGTGLNRTDRPATRGGRAVDAVTGTRGRWRCTGRAGVGPAGRQRRDRHRSRCSHAGPGPQRPTVGTGAVAVYLVIGEPPVVAGAVAVTTAWSPSG